MDFKDKIKVLLIHLSVLYFAIACASTAMGGCINGDCANGHGTYTYPDGSVYAGQWRNDKFNGQGTFTYHDGSVFIGQWKNNLRNGQGTLTRPSGSKYQGQWKNDKFDGQGIYHYADDSKYQGQWKNNKRNGPGVYTTASGSQYQGQWKNGKLIGKGILTTSDGQKFIGYFNKEGKLIKGYVPMAKVEGRAKAEARKKVELEARKKADAKIKAELETKRAAETAARKKAELEARKKADARKKAELETKRAAETAARKKAELEAREKADARKKAELEAKRAAETAARKKADAKIKAELEAKRKTEPLAAVKPEAEKVIDSKAKDRVKEVPQAEAKAGPGQKPFTTSNGMKFVYISAGTFTMGSSEDESGRYENEIQHQVTLTRGFYMKITEVTQGQWRSLMGNNPSFFNGCGDDCPVEQVSWNDAQQFIWRLNQLEGADKYRLPTEAEWEYACRAGSATAFASREITALECENDTSLTEVAWFCGNSAKTIHPVAQKKPNAWGLYDMHGNVSELCQDWYGEYPPDQITDPKGPASGIDRTVRGGGWKSQARHCRSACRGAVSAGQKIYDVGFRLVMMP